MLKKWDLRDALRVDERRGAGTVPAEAADLVTSWRTGGLQGSDAFAGYLDELGIDEEELARRLTGGCWHPAGGALEWVTDLDQMVAATPYDGPLTATVGAQTYAPAPFESFVRPLAGWYVDTVEALTVHPLAPQLSGDLADHAASVTLDVVLRPLVEYYQDTRKTTQAGYRQFGRSLAARQAREEFLTAYPAMARDLCHSLRHSLRACVEVLDRFEQDRPALTTGLLPDDAPITGIQLSAGDTHHGGRSVAILTTGTGHRVVYRPHDVRIFAAYHRVARAVPNHRCHAPRVLAGDGYGWTEHLERDGSATTEYYRRFGAVLALTWLLGARDLHMENVIATRHGPVPIDLETILSAPPRAARRDAGRIASDILTDSVLGSGMLPMHTTVADTDLDVSALTGGLAPASAHVEALVGLDGDDLVVELVPATTGTRANQPSGASPTAVHAAIDAVAEEFAAICGFATAFAQQVTSALTQDGSYPVRIVARPTRLYSLLLHESRHPSYSRSILARQHLFDRLRAKTGDTYLTQGVIGHEITQLLDGDIPYFTVDSQARQLRSPWGPTGSCCATTPLEQASTRLQGLTTGAVHRQAELIGEAIRCATYRPGSRTVPRPGGSATQLHHDQLVALTDTIYQRFADNAVLGEDDATWIGMATTAASGAVQLRPLGTSLFDGLAGVAIGLLDAASILPDSGADQLARRALEPVADELDRWCQRPRGPVGAYSGSGGLAYALGRYTHQTRDTRWHPLLECYVQSAATSVAGDTYLDVSSGTAGALAVTMALHDRGLCSDKATDRLVHAAVARLTSTAQRGKGTLCWPVGDQQIPLGGFSHGASGIGWALGLAAPLLPGAADLARAALRFDDTYCDPATGLWQDMRPETVALGASYPVHWCHGAAGIALARHLAGSTLEDDHLLQEGTAAAELVAAHPVPPNDSLCHGAFGNLAILQQVLGATCRTADAYQERALGALTSAAPVPGLGFPTQHAPGLMVGHAGTLHALARIIDPTLPAVLWLQI